MCSSETISSKKPKESRVCESCFEFLHISLGHERKFRRVKCPPNTAVPAAESLWLPRADASTNIGAKPGGHEHGGRLARRSIRGRRRKGRRDPGWGRAFRRSGRGQSCEPEPGGGGHDRGVL